MAYRNVLSQMFDVRPRTARGELDVERIAKIRAVLDLAQSHEIFLKSRRDYEQQRTINLKETAVKEQSVDRVSFGEKKSVSGLSEEEKKWILRSLLPIKEKIELKNVQEGILEAVPPSREEILARLEEIEQLNNYLAEHGLEDEKTHEDAQEAIIDLEQELLAGLVLGERDFAENQEQLTSPILEAAAFGENLLTPGLSIPEDEPSVIKEPLEDIIKFEPTGESAPGLPWQELPFVQPAVGLAPSSEEWLVEMPRFNFRRSVVTFASAGVLIWLVIFGLSLAGRGLSAKDNIMSSGLEAYRAMLVGKDLAAGLDFSAAEVNFATAYQNFLQADQEVNKMGRVLVSVLEQLPGGSKVESGTSLIELGKNLAQAGQSFSRIGNLLMLEKVGDYFSAAGPSLTQKIAEIKNELNLVQRALSSANNNLAQVSNEDLPPELAEPLDSLRKKLPSVAAAVGELNSWSDVFSAIFGQERAKKYLLVFQNNAEARATGGFIGSYGVLDLDQGRIKNLFVDNIFNLDGQLHEKVVPPKPIQKISTAWSMHDANWFADWPTSAQKIMWFYEKAGGATPDGVISLTPAVVENLLVLTGPIWVPEFNISLSEDNFIEVVQYKVEADYDKELNQPKKILVDFAPKFLDKLWEIWPQKYSEIFEVLGDALAQKNILFYFSDSATQKVFSDQGWGGELLATDKDYLSVVNTNINGFKTDRVVEQKIYHQSEVQLDGTIIDTVKIVRTHLGGASEYDWYNRVNASYLRVYVPAGSQLLSAKGHTLEGYSPPVDYKKLGFREDPDILAQEQSLQIHESGTQIFAESGKTVFGNWAYVSPGKTVEIEYQYRLPFKLNLNTESFTYSLLAQKQAGSSGGSFESELTLPQYYQISWQYPAALQMSGNKIKFNGDLKTDEFYGVVLGK